MRIAECDKEISGLLKAQINTDPNKTMLKTTDKAHKSVNKNALRGIDLNQTAFQYLGGIDLMGIEGMSHATVLSIISEIGPDGFKKFGTEKRFNS